MGLRQQQCGEAIGGDESVLIVRILIAGDALVARVGKAARIKSLANFLDLPLGAWPSGGRPAHTGQSAD